MSFFDSGCFFPFLLLSFFLLTVPVDDSTVDTGFGILATVHSTHTYHLYKSKQ